METTEKALTATEKMDNLVRFTGFSKEEIGVLKNTVAKGTTDTELAYFLNFSKSLDLNPFLKETWCYKDGKGNMIVFAGRDGFLRIAQRSDRWNGMVSSFVCANDHIEINITAGTADHIPNVKDRGDVIGAYAVVSVKGIFIPVCVWIDRKEFDRGFNVWKSNPGSMCEKVAETKALKKAFGISGLQSEYDFSVQNGVAVNIKDVPAKTTEDGLREQIIDRLKEYQGDDRDGIAAILKEKSEAGEADLTFLQNIASQLSLNIN